MSEHLTSIRPVATWETVCAYSAFAVTVPSALWRVLMIVGLVPGTTDLRAFELEGNPALGYTYVVGLSIVQLTFASLTVGLVRPWGTTLRGRRIPTGLAVVPGLLGGLAVVMIFDIQMVSAILHGHRPDAGLVTGWPLVVMVACYAPILLWGPLELVSVLAYWRRRTNRRAADVATTVQAQRIS